MWGDLWFQYNIRIELLQNTINWVDNKTVGDGQVHADDYELDVEVSNAKCV